MSSKPTKKKKTKKPSTNAEKSIGSVKSRRGQKDDQPPPQQHEHGHSYDHQHGEEEEGESQESGSAEESSEHIQTLPQALKKQAPSHNNHQQQQQQFYGQQQIVPQFGPQGGGQSAQLPPASFTQPAQQQISPTLIQSHPAQQIPTTSQTLLSEKKHRDRGRDESPMLHGRHKHTFEAENQDDHLKSTQHSFVKRQSSAGQQSSNCVHHAHPFAFFCETCEEPICTDCTIVGPHNNQLHRINRLNDAYKSRYLKLNEQIQKNLITKKQQLLAQIHRIEYRVEEIKYVKTIIERDARQEYEGLLERLRQAEGTKLAILHHDISELQKDLDQINEIGTTFSGLTSPDITDLSPFLLRSRFLYDTTEHLVAKPFKTTIDVYPYDLPRELTELRLQLQRTSAQKQLIEFKNEVIWKLLNEQKDPSRDLQLELEQQTSEEVFEWSKLVDKFQVELERYQVVCCFCGVLLDPKIVNLPCAKNGVGSVITVRVQEQPAQSDFANEKHFFSKPNN